MPNRVKHIHPRISHSQSSLACSWRPIRPHWPSVPAVALWLLVSAELFWQPRMAGQATRLCNSTVPGRAASWHALLPSASCLESTSHSRGLRGCRVPGCPNSILCSGTRRRAVRKCGSGADLAAGQSRGGCSMAAADLEHHARSPWCLVDSEAETRGNWRGGCFLDMMRIQGSGSSVAPRGPCPKCFSTSHSGRDLRRFW